MPTQKNGSGLLERCDMPKRLDRLPVVKTTVGLSRSEIYRRIAIGDFPKPVPLGKRAVAWDADEIQAWVRERIEARNSKANAG